MHLLIIFLKRYRYFLLISLFYFLIRLINLTKLPIFNDEAIYLDWGWRMTHIPGNLYFSLYDGKQPFLMWIFGIFESLLVDPLFAGRLVSVLTGFLTLLGIYSIGTQYFNKKVVYFAALFYVVTPLFSFYDRQALMESSITAVNIWSCYFFLRFIENPIRKYAIWLGAILGIGFFIKSSALILIFTFIILGIVIFLMKFRKNKIYFKNFLLVVLVILIINILLFINPGFWNTLYLTNRYSLSILELLRFPISIWAQNIGGFLEILFSHTTILGILSASGMVVSMKSSDRRLKYMVLWMVTTILLIVLFAKSISARYSVSFLPFIPLFSAYFLFEVLARRKMIAFYLCCLAILTTFSLTILQILSPIDYFSLLSRVTRFSQKVDYVTDWTAGYGISETREFLSREAKNTKIIAAVRIDAGNPENAIFTYYAQNRDIKPIYLDANINKNISKFNCIKSSFPIYFISRDQQLARLDKFLIPVKKFYKPEKKSFIGIYRVKSECQSKILTIDERSFNYK